MDAQDRTEIATLERMNADLTASLGRCRALLKDCRSKLAANINEPCALHEDDAGAKDVRC